MTAFTRPALALLLCALSSAGTIVRSEDTVLLDKQSAYNHIVVTENDDGTRVLRFDRYGARQSLVKLGDPDYLGLAYVQSALVGLALIDEPRRMLVIGIGGGSLPMFLQHHFPSAAIDAVDIDSDVIDAAKQFFGFR